MLVGGIIVINIKGDLYCMEKFLFEKLSQIFAHYKTQGAMIIKSFFQISFFFACKMKMNFN